MGPSYRRGDFPYVFHAVDALPRLRSSEQLTHRSHYLDLTRYGKADLLGVPRIRGADVNEAHHQLKVVIHPMVYLLEQLRAFRKGLFQQLLISTREGDVIYDNEEKRPFQESE